MTYSGKFVLRVDPPMHRQLAEAAARKQVSLNALCLERLGSGAGVNSSSLWAGLQDKLKKVLGKSYLGLVLFGSEARGEATAESDIDLLIVLKSGTKLHREIYKKWDEECAALVESRTNPHFAVIPDDPADAGSLWLEVALDGIVLDDPNGSVQRALQNLRAYIATGAKVRKMKNDAFYWVSNEK